MRKRFFWAGLLLTCLLFLTMPALASSQGDTVELQLSVTSADAYFVQLEYTIDENIFEFVSATPPTEGSVIGRKGFAAVRVDKEINSKNAGSLFLRIRDTAPDGEYTVTPVVKAAYDLNEQPTSVEACFSTVIVGEEKAKTVAYQGGNYLVDPKGTATFLGLADPAATSVSIADAVELTRNGKKIKYNVTSIADEACKGRTGLKEVTIGKKVTVIGKSAFSGCKKLTAVSGGAALITISDSAFQKCSALKKFAIGNKITSIGNNAFSECTSLTVVSGGNSLTKIGDAAFQKCTALVEVTIGKKVKTIGKNAFSGCKKLSRVSGGAGVVSIGASAFQKCASLPEITINKNVTSIGANAFQGCSSLGKIVLKIKTFKKENLGENAFKGIKKNATFVCDSRKIITALEPVFSAKGKAPGKPVWTTK